MNKKFSVKMCNIRNPFQILLPVLILYFYSPFHETLLLSAFCNLLRIVV